MTTFIVIGILAAIVALTLLGAGRPRGAAPSDGILRERRLRAPSPESEPADGTPPSGNPPLLSRPLRGRDL